MTYAVVVMPLPDEDGGGFVGIVPDLPGCMGDGETRAEAAADAENAILEWLDEAERLGWPIPEPGSSAQKWIDERKALVKALEALASDNASLEGRVSLLQSLVSRIVREYEERDSAQGRLDLHSVAAIASVGQRSRRH